MKQRNVRSGLALIGVMFVTAVSLEAQIQQGAGQQRQQAAERRQVRVSGQVGQSLDKLGFVVVPNHHETSLSYVYRRWKYEHLPVVVTSDAALHTCHLHFDWYQRYLEVAYLRDDLVNLTDALVARMVACHDEARQPQVKEAALAGAAYFLVGKRLLTGTDAGDAPEPWKGRIESELRLIREAAGFAPSPLFGYVEDYSQYKPRGHYSRSETLKNYFRAMMWYGRMAYRCGGPDPKSALQQTRTAILISRALEGSKVRGEEALAVWRRIYETTAFFAGRSDDLLPTDYIEVMKKAAGKCDPADDGDVGRLVAEARRMRKPRILGAFELAQTAGGPDWRESTAGMRLLGQRYAVDSEVMQQLVFDSVKGYLGDAKAEPVPFTLAYAGGLWIRAFPRGLDVMAVLGFPQAERLLHDDGDDRYQGYADRLAKLKQGIAGTDESQWQSDLYHMRLKALAALARTPEGRLPKAMKCEEWLLKQLTAALGSWTELRHDTILYTKESYTSAQSAMAGLAKNGREPPPPPPPRGYVEPVPDVYRALRQGVEAVSQRIQTLRYPEDKAFVGDLTRFAGHLQTLETLSRKELAGEVLTDAEYAFIENIGAAFRLPESGLPHYRDVVEEFRGVTDDAMPVAADVHTEANTRLVLEEAVGAPWTLYMVCPVDGSPTVCLGVVYGYYEFKQPMSNRLTAEAWRKMLTEEKTPAPPSWLSRYVVKGN